MELMEASRQWANRPADERFWTLQELYDATFRHRIQARTASVSSDDLRVEPVEGEVQLVGKTGNPAQFTHWSFGQLSTLARAPAQYLRKLPATLAAQNINYGLKQRGPGEVKLLLRQNNGFYVRAFTSERYTRIWNYEIVERLMQLPEYWRAPPARAADEDDPRARAATQEDLIGDPGSVSGLSVRLGDMIAPAGLYASDEDMFAFMIDETHRLLDGGVARGFFVSNSEVGKMSFRVKLFYYVSVCGNHIVWDARDVKEIRLRHVGSVDERAFKEFEAELISYANEETTEEEAKILQTQRFKLGHDKKQVLDFVFGKGFVSRKAADDAYALAEENEATDGDPRTAWGYAMGVTRLSQQSENADQRTQLDAAAGRILNVAF